jgi:hypothetical protein
MKPRVVLPENYVKGGFSVHKYENCITGVESGDVYCNTTLYLIVSAETRPPARNREPVTIEFSIYVVDINSINVEDMDFR